MADNSLAARGQQSAGKRQLARQTGRTRDCIYAPQGLIPN